ncbi:MAG: Hpt domain-containing protein [Burkholderiales bacterium]|nr:Hpt domain-containing protein [Burkholderiales bacterium]
MSVQTEFDLGSLIWVKGEIDQALEKSNQCLKKFATTADAAELKFAQTHLHQVRGAVEMVGLAGAAKFAEELEVSIRAVEHGEAQPDVLAAVTDAAASLAQYLESLINGSPDLALKLLPAYRRVRLARGEENASGADLFFPPLSASLPKGLTPLQLDAATLAQLLKNARSRFEAGLLKWLKGDKKEGAQWMMQALLGIARSQTSNLQRGFWWSAAAMIEGSIDNRAQLDLALKPLLSRLNQQLKRLSDGGGKVAERLFRDILYVVAKLDTRSPHCMAVRKAFELDGLLPSGALEDDAQQLASLQIARDLRELMNQLKDNWGRVGGGTVDRLSVVKQQATDIATRGAKLDIAGFAALAQEIAKVVGQITGTPSEHQALEIATALLLLENALIVFPERSTEFAAQAEAMRARLQGASDVPEVTLLDEVSRKAQERLLMNQVAQEIQANLGQIEQVLDDFFRDPSSRAELRTTDGPIRQIRGALAMLDESDARALLDACAEIVRRNQADDYEAPAEELEFLAEAFSGLGFYVDALKREEANRAHFIAPWLQQIRGDQGEADTAAAPSEADLIAAELEAEPEAVAAAPAPVTPAAPAEPTPIDVLSVPAADVPAAVSDAAVDAELLEVYLEEAVEVLDTITAHVADVREQPGNRDALTVIRRGFHTLKGSGRMVGLNQLGEVAWAVEQVLNKWLQEEKRATPALFRLIEGTTAGFTGWVEELKATGTAQVEASALFTLAEQLKSGADPDADAAPEAIEAPAEAPQQIEAVVEAAMPEADIESAEAIAVPALDVVEMDIASADEASAALADVEQIAEADIVDLAAPAESIDLPALDLAPAAEATVDVVAPETAAAIDFQLDIEPEVAATEAVAEATPATALPLSLDETPVEIVEAAPVETVDFSLDEPTPAVPDQGEVAAVEHETVEFVMQPLAEEAPLQDDGVELTIGNVVISRALFGIFLDEAYKHFATLNDAFIDFGTRGEVLPAFIHAAHTLCGIANTTGFSALGELGHAIEQALIAHQKQGKEPQLNDREALSMAIDKVGGMLGEISHYNQPAEELQTVAMMLAQANRLKDEMAADSDAAAHAADMSAAALEETVVAAAAPIELEPPLHADIHIEELDLDLAPAESIEAIAPAATLASPEADAAPLIADLHLDDLRLDDVQEDAGDEELTLEVPAADDSWQAVGAEPALADLVSLPPAEVTEIDLELDEQEGSDSIELPTLAKTDAEEATALPASSSSLRYLDSTAEAPAEPTADAEAEAPEALIVEDAEPVLDAIEVIEPAPAPAESEEADFIALLATAAGPDADAPGETAPTLEVANTALDLEIAIDAAQILDETGFELGLPEDRAANDDSLAPTSTPEHAPDLEIETLPVAMTPAEHGESADEATFDVMPSLDIELAPVDEAIVVESTTPAVSEALAEAIADPQLNVPEEPSEAAVVDALAEAGRRDGGEALGAALALAPTDRIAEITVQDELDDQLLPIFLEEAQELMPQIAADLRALAGDGDKHEPMESLKRVLHTLKGSARMAGAMRLGEATHNLETRLLNAGEGLLPAVLEALDADYDAVVELHDRLINGEPVAEGDEAAEIDAPVTEATGAAPAAAAPARPAAGQALGLVDPEAGKSTVRVRADLVDRLVNQAGEVSIARTRIESEMLALKRSLFDLTDNVGRLRSQLREIEIQAESQMQSRQAHASDLPDFDPLEFDRFSRLQELTRFMAESVNDVATVQHNLLKNLDESSSALQQQSRLTRDLQQELMRVRMVPFSSLSERLYRLVRQTGKETGKKVNLELRGGRVEIDRSVLEKMVSPFEHMLRNAIDHGLEQPEVRISRGKTEFGEILVEARQEGNELVLTLRDDGAGLNLERIKQKGYEKNLLEPGVDYTDHHLMQLIFAAGFSTASQVTQLSGRGIGMDVVKAEIEDLGGRVDVDSQAGRGTVFTIHLPLTLAVTQTVLVKVADKTYAIPSVMVEQVQELKADPLQRLYQARQAEWMGNVYPFHYLPRLLGDNDHQPEQKRYNTVVLLRSGLQRIALHVDELIKNQEVVVKNIGPQLVRVAGIAGATVLGNGEIVLILNPLALAQRRAETPVADFDASLAATKPTAAEILQVSPVVMVVDDSLTVRKITGRLLAREGYQVVTAKDGVDALQQLQDVRPAVMLLDVEMPRMDGFELTRNLRANADTRGIPIIMITSRTADKHKNYAFELGVSVFLGKPYQEDELLEHIRRLIGEEMPIA